MSSVIPYVPNLKSAPANPQFKDCYYNITSDKYYAYDGTQWVEAKLENEPSDMWKFSYQNSGDTEYTTQIVTNFNSLVNLAKTQPNAIKVKFETQEPWCRRVASTGNTKGTWGLIQLKIDGVWVSVGRIAPKIIIKSYNYSAREVPETIIVNNQQLNTVYCNNVLVYVFDLFDGYILTYLNENNETEIKRYTYEEDLITFLQTTDVVFKTASIVEREV